MCTVITETTKLKIATKDIEVYKLCREVPGGVSSDIIGYFYEADKLNEAKIDFTEEEEYFNDVEGNYLDTLKDPIFIKEGFHSSINKRNLSKDNCFWGSSQLCRFIIPKGSEYYKSKIGMVVSNQIIFKEILS